MRGSTVQAYSSGTMYKIILGDLHNYLHIVGQCRI